MTSHRAQSIVKPISTLGNAAGVVAASTRWRRVALAVVLLVVFGGALLRAEESASKGAVSKESPPRESCIARLQNLAWMAGEWKSAQGEDILEERWSAPIGNSIIGTFRWIKPGGKVWMFELMTFTAEGDDVIFRLRHFSAAMVPWEAQEKEAALTYKLIKQTPDESVFENPDRDSPRRFVFRKGKNSLTIVLEGYKDGKPTTGEFSFTRS